MSKILIIGNGFDLNLGLKTSYSDFIHSDQFQKLIDDNSSLAKHLQTVHGNQNWVDIEHELKNYTMYRFRIKAPYDYHVKNMPVITSAEQLKCLQSEFTELKATLAEYLKSQMQIDQPERLQKMQLTQAFQILKAGYLKNSDAQTRFDPLYFDEIFTFNYTNFFQYFLTGRELKQCKPHHIHGSLNDNNIIFGIEDDAFDAFSLRVEPPLASSNHLKGSDKYNYTFLNKSDHAAFGKSPDVSNAIIDADEVHFFGCSLGDTDNAHFSRALKEISDDAFVKGKTKRNIYFYVYGKDGYRSIFNRIMALTSSKVSEFKLINNVTFYDLKNSQEIDQTWLNS